MIALEGGWGSGKTTVINLLRKELVREEKVTLLSLNAWAHEGDPLRRTFLESLIQHFVDIKWIERNRWDKILQGLAHRRKVTNTRTIPKASPLGKWVAMSALLVPVGASLLAAAVARGVTSVGGPVSWPFIFGMVFSFAWFFVILGNWARIHWKRRTELPGGGAPETLTTDDDRISEWALLDGHFW